MSCCLSYHDHSEQKSQFMSVMWLQFPHSTPVSWVRVKPVSVVWCPHPSPRHSRRLKRRVSATNPRNHLQLFSVSPGPAPGVTTLHTVSTISTISTVDTLHSSRQTTREKVDIWLREDLLICSASSTRVSWIFPIRYNWFVTRRRCRCDVQICRHSVSRWSWRCFLVVSKRFFFTFHLQNMIN